MNLLIWTQTMLVNTVGKASGSGSYFSINWQAVSSICTLITAILMLIAFLNTRYQNKQAHKPCFLLQRSEIKSDGYSSQNSNIFNINIFDELKSNQYPIKLSNIGLGPAKDIEIEWKIKKDFYQIVKDEDKKNKFKISYNDRMLSVGINNHEVTYMLPASLKQKFDFVTPYSDQNASLTITFPNIIIVMLYVYYCLTKQSNYFGDELDENYVSLIVKYKGIDNIRYNDNFSVKFGLSTIGSNIFLETIQFNK